MKRLLLVVVALLAVTLSATHSSAFPLGVYSSLGNKDSVYNHRDMYISWMNSLSYNSNIMELFSEGTQPNGEFVHSELDFSGVLASMASHGIDAIVKDRSWKEGEDEHSSFYLSKSNYVKIQAQIFDQNTVGNAYLTNNDNYWYSSNGVHINGSEPIPFAPTPGLNRVGGYNQTDNVWECVPNDHVAGYAYGDLKSRWGSDPPLVHKLFSIQPPPPTETDDESVFTDSDALYITYHIKIVSPPELPANTPLLYFRVAFYDQNGNVIAIPSVVTGPANTVITDGLLTNTVYSTFATPGYFDVTAKVRFQDLAHPPGFPDVSLITFDNTWTIQSLNPRLYWYDNCTLYLDNIEIEDSIYRDLNSNDPLYLAAVTARVQEVSLLGSNVVGIYTNDEPTQAQFDSYELMQGMVGTTRLSMTAVKRQDSHILKQSGPYNHYVVFDHEAQPKVYMPDPYPVLGTVGWSSGITIGNLHLQSEISSMNKYAYDYNRRMCSSSEFFYPVVQAFGRWHGGTSQIWDNFFMRPPSATQQMLQYLPLCFGADGIFNYRLIGFHNTTSGSGDYCAITCDYDQATTTDPAYYYEPIVDQQTYDTLLECNPRVRMYGELLNKNGVSWDLSASLEQTGTLQEIDLVAVNTDYQPNLANYKLNSIQLGPENGSYYKGYIQMGFYSDDNIPSLMLVNRRSNYFNGSPASVTPILAANLVPPNDDFPAYFPEFPGQVVIFEPSNASHTMFGTHVAFHDPYDNVIYPTDIDGTISVDIGPGDGKLVQMCSSLPALVTSDAELKEIAYLTGSVTIDDGAHVSIQNGTNTTILANSTIRVKGGSSLSLSGTVSIKESVTIIVEEGSSINFNDAICTWGEGSTLEVTGSTLSIDSSSMDRSDTASRWNGIRVIESSHVTINDATISNTESNTIHDSDLLITNSRFNILPNLWGLSLKNSNLGYQTSIINTEPGCGFYGDPNFCSMGILLYAMKNQVVINNVDFQNLYFGVYKYSTPYATDTISECRFVNCTNGIYLHGNDNGTSIEQCSFACDNGRTQGTGILLVASAPSISTSNFTNLYRGVFTEYSLLGIGLGSSGVHESNFYYCETGIESRSSNHRVKANYFNRNNTGILNHAGSNLNLSSDANNVFMNSIDNIVFYDTMPYESTIQLFNGHNDFYHLLDDIGVCATDFDFDTNYYDMPNIPDFKINASNNWFQDDQVTFNDPAFIDYVYVDDYDHTPSLPAPPPENDRLFTALEYESQQMYEIAGVTFKAIIDEQLAAEKTYVTSAIDGLYRCTQMIPNPAWELTDYFDAKAVQFAIDEPSLSALLDEYLAKTYVLDKDFQAAVDLIQLRIDNPISEIDSLRAVLDLEIVLQLAAMEEDKRPLSTKYVQYQYPDMQVFDVMHSRNWDRYSELLHQNDSNIASFIAPIPQIQSNYPNPFNPTTTIAFSIPDAGKVRLAVYNIKGQKVKDLINSDLPRGTHKLVWDGNDDANRNV